MAVPYHTHTFEIPTATKQDMAARAATDKAVTPSVLGTAATADVSQFATAEQGKKADSAVQPQNLNSLAYKDKITVNEINTNGAPSNTTFLSGSGWQNLTGGGDMTGAIYDPQNKQTDAFDMANMKEATNAKVMTAAERNKLAGIDGLEQSKWNNGTDATEALISPLKFLATLNAMGVWRGGYRFGTATSGGFVLPNGMIVQFGTTWPAASDYWMNFPLTFPNACGFFTVIGAYNIDANRYIAMSTSNVGAGGADVRSRDIYGGSVGGVYTFPCYWFAVGF